MANVIRYTVVSKSDEGRYYLVNGWNKYGKYWSSGVNPIRNGFKTKGLALRSLKKLLNIMPDYRNDEFSVVAMCDDLTVVETDDVIPVFD